MLMLDGVPGAAATLRARGQAMREALRAAQQAQQEEDEEEQVCSPVAAGLGRGGAGVLADAAMGRPPATHTTTDAIHPHYPPTHPPTPGHGAGGGRRGGGRCGQRGRRARAGRVLQCRRIRKPLSPSAAPGVEGPAMPNPRTHTHASSVFCTHSVPSSALPACHPVPRHAYVAARHPDGALYAVLPHPSKPHVSLCHTCPVLPARATCCNFQIESFVPCIGRRGGPTYAPPPTAGRLSARRLARRLNPGPPAWPACTLATPRCLLATLLVTHEATDAA